MARQSHGGELPILAARRFLGDSPQKVSSTFELLRGIAAAAHAIREDHELYIDSAGFAALRRIVLEIGRRLREQRRLSRPEDVFLLDWAEFLELAADVRAKPSLLGLRRAQMARSERLTPPAALRGGRGNRSGSPRRARRYRGVPTSSRARGWSSWWGRRARRAW